MIYDIGGKFKILIRTDLFLIENIGSLTLCLKLNILEDIKFRHTKDRGRHLC